MEAQLSGRDPMAAALLSPRQRAVLSAICDTLVPSVAREAIADHVARGMLDTW
jgi:hypothetical protein